MQEKLLNHKGFLVEKYWFELQTPAIVFLKLGISQLIDWCTRFPSLPICR